MDILSFPELFYLISASLNDKEKIFLTSCSKIIHNFKSLLILDSEYNLEEINDKWRAKNIIIKEFTLESKIKELLENLILESIIVNSEYTKFVSNNTNIKLFHSEEIIEKIISHECPYLAMKIMLNNNGTIDNINKQFIKASICGYLFVIKLLIKKGADIHFKDDMAIIYASRWGHLPIVELLIDLGANVHAQDDQAIISASDHGYLPIVELLIESGADIHAQNDIAIVYSSSQGYLSIAKLLINYGANIRAYNDGAIRCASYRGNLPIVKLLIELGADIHARDNDAIIYASEKGHLDVVKLLIESGADIHAQNNAALRVAIKNNHSDIIKLLEKN